MTQRRTYPVWCKPKSSSEWDRTVRSLVHKAGLRFHANRSLMHGVRPNGQGAFCTPDLTFPTRKLAVFLDGCYWHGCPQHYPERAKPYDRMIDSGLAAHNWSVLRVWECDGSELAASRIIAEIRRAAA